MLEFEIYLTAELFNVGFEEGDVFLHRLAECPLLELEGLDGICILSLAAHQNI